MKDAAHLTKDDIAQRLREHGIVPTQQRVEIARVCFAGPQHLSAERVFVEANARSASVSKATVYNTLGLFAKKGLVREVIVDPARVFYDTNTSDHHHFFNVDTGTLQDIDATAVSINDLPALPDNTVADGVDVIIRIRNRA